MRKTVVFSAKGDYYYVKELATTAGFWLPLDGRREEALPFIFWKVPSGQTRRVSGKDPLVLAYRKVAETWAR